jgi:hypothetical protein
VTTVASECPGTCDLIDDFEAAGVSNLNDGIIQTMGRTGYWYVYNDATAGGKQLPDPATHSFIPEMIVPPRGMSNYALHSSGSGFTNWGAGFGFDVDNAGGGADGGNGTPIPYDTTQYGYKGIYFFARIGQGSTTGIRVNFSDGMSNPNGGRCDPTSTTKGKQCNDDPGAVVTLTTDWKGYEIDFSSLTRQGFGPAGSFDPKTLYNIHWQVGTNKTFDVWVDDLYFIK